MYFNLTWPLFVYFRSFQQQFHSKNCALQTQILEVKEKYADHSTTTTAQLVMKSLQVRILTQDGHFPAIIVAHDNCYFSKNLILPFEDGDGTQHFVELSMQDDVNHDV